MFMENEKLQEISRKNTNITFQDIEEDLQKNIKQNYVFPVGELCDRLDLKVELQPLAKGCSGYIDIQSKTIYINNSSEYTASRMRFTIAHEIAHYVLHEGIKNRFDENNNYSQEELDQEYEANDFAGELLMPKNIFINLYKKYKSNLTKIADFFGVSTKAVEIRAWRLGLNYSF